MPPDVPAGSAARDQIRAQIAASRARRDSHQEVEDDRARTARAFDLVDALLSPGSVVACYLSRPGEPGTLALVDQLAAAGHRVLVPKLGPLPDGRPRRDPDWAWYDGAEELRPGVFRIPEPAGPGLGAAALATADLVIAAALAAGTDGSRIGTGGGWFDRALPSRRPGIGVVVLLNDDEVRPCPQAAHDQAVDWLVTPSRTLRATPTS